MTASAPGAAGGSQCSSAVDSVRPATSPGTAHSAASPSSQSQRANPSPSASVPAQTAAPQQSASAQSRAPSQSSSAPSAQLLSTRAGAPAQARGATTAAVKVAGTPGRNSPSVAVPAGSGGTSASKRKL